MVRDYIETRLRKLNGTASALNGGLPKTGDFDLNPDVCKEFFPATRTLRPAAVLMPLVERQAGLTVLLTKRADHLTDHAGQISFPGGRVEKDDHDVIETALRETEEEIGINRSLIDIAGQLDEYETGTGFRVTPVIGFVQPEFSLKLDPFEVAAAFEVPLDFLMNPANHKMHRKQWKGGERQFYAMPWGDYNIWGATAGMIVNFYNTINDQR